MHEVNQARELSYQADFCIHKRQVAMSTLSTGLSQRADIRTRAHLGGIWHESTAADQEVV
jgi:hypothetical protein